MSTKLLSVIVMRFLYLSTRKIAEEDKLSLKHFLMEQVPHLKQVHFRQFHLEKICQELDVFINDF